MSDTYDYYIRAYSIVRSGGQIDVATFKPPTSMALDSEGHVAVALGVIDARSPNDLPRSKSVILEEVGRLLK